MADVKRGLTGTIDNREGALNALLPYQGGQADKVLKTNGTTHLWEVAPGADPDLIKRYAMLMG